VTGWRSSICNANGIGIHYLRTGGAKPAVVLLHGLTGSSACWTCLARALERDYDVVMPDARGHGASDAPPAGYAYEDLARDVAGLIAALRLKQPVVLGHSMGGMTAAVLAQHAGTALRALVLADPTFLSPERQCEVHASDALAQHLTLLGRDRQQVLDEARHRHPQRPPDLLELVIDARMQTHPATFAVLTPPNPDYRRLLREVSVAVLLVTAERGVVSAAAAREIEQSNPRVRSACIADAGHGLVYDQPARIARVVKDFLDSLPDSSPSGRRSNQVTSTDRSRLRAARRGAGIGVGKR
jgi:N-formylmaleamate deformylase